MTVELQLQRFRAIHPAVIPAFGLLGLSGLPGTVRQAWAAAEAQIPSDNSSGYILNNFCWTGISLEGAP